MTRQRTRRNRARDGGASPRPVIARQHRPTGNVLLARTQRAAPLIPLAAFCTQMRRRARRRRRRRQEVGGTRRALADAQAVATAPTAQPKLSVPFIIVQWPGNEQKNVYAPPLVSLLVGKVIVVDSPPPITLVLAITRGSFLGR